eukprot:scaffold2.g6945.t1
MEPNAPGSEAADVTPAPRFDTASPDGGLPCRPNSRPNPPPASSGRGGKGAGRPPAGPLFCQVEGCAAPLEGLKDYHQASDLRYRVCEVHLKIDYICGRYQPLEDFDGDKRSCRERLEEALQLASALAAAMGGGEGGAPGSSPVTPTPDVMLTLLKVYAAMFHYELESAVLRPLRPPTDLGPGEPIDAATVHQLLAQQGASGGGGGAPAPPPQPPPRLQRPQQAQRQSLQPQQRQTQVQQQLWMTPDPPASLVVHTPIQPPDPGLVAAAVAAAMAAGREITTEEIAALTGLQ